MRGLLALSYKKEFFVSVAGTFKLIDKTKFSDINYKINVSLMYILIMRGGIKQQKELTNINDHEI